MNLIDSLGLVRERRLAASGAAISMLAPVAASGLVISISEAIKNKKAILNTRVLNKGLAKVKHALMVANRDQTVPQVDMEPEESTILNLALNAITTGVTSLVGTVCSGLFSFVPFAIEMVAAPMFALVTYTVVDLLPVLFSEAGLVALGVIGSVGAALYIYRRWKAGTLGSIFQGGSGVPKPADTGAKSGGAASPLTLQAGLPAVPYGTPASAGQASAPGASLGVRNNNPGNLIYAGQPGALPKSGTFAQFPSADVGLYNLGRQIELYYGRGKNSVQELISTFAPKNENDTERYIATVAGWMGVGPGDVLDLHKKDTLIALMTSIIRYENTGQPYSAQQLDEAADRALAGQAVIPAAQAAAAPSGSVGGTVQSSGQFVMPVSGRVSSSFGARAAPIAGASTDHKGVDIAAPLGAPIYAADDGVIEEQKSSRSFGNVVMIRHQDFWTRYGHMSNFTLKKGDTVRKGQQIGQVGSTGVSTGTHLHFEIQPLNATAPVDPATYLPQLRRGQSVTAQPIQVPTPTDPAYITQGPKIISLNQ